MEQQQQRGHGRSVSDCRGATLVALSACLNNISSTMSNASLSAAELKEVEDFRELEVMIEKTKRSVAWVEARREDSQCRAKALSFSQVKIHDLIDLGVECNAPLDQAEFETLLAANTATLGAKQKVVRNWDSSDMTQVLRIILEQVDQKTEAAARMTIDQWLINLLKLCSGLSLVIKLWPELTISRSSDDAVVVRYGDCETRLTGFTDYALLALQYRESLKGKVNDAEDYYFIRNNSPPAAPVLIMEAKNTRDDLLMHLPQVIAQAVAALVINQTYSNISSIKHIPFALTNGQKWIFGIVFASEGDTKRCWHTTPMSFENEETILMTALMCWSTQPAHRLASIMRCDITTT